MDAITAIDKKIGEVRTESLDISVGEILGLHEQFELVIQPDFQRLFRWSLEQQSRLIESVLLELPIPSIFVIEKETGVLELIDGLQRVSSLLHFIAGSSLAQHPNESNPEAPASIQGSATSTTLPQTGADNEDQRSRLRLVGCDLVPELNGQTYDDLPLTLRLRLKRTGIRTVIIKRQSSQFLRYEMFKRLNTGGSKLSDQDIRNVNARMIGDTGAAFYEKLVQCANNSSFKTTLELLPQASVDSRTDQELVLRFFASKNFRHGFKGNVSDWLDSYMDGVLLNRWEINDADFEQFSQVFQTLAEKFDAYAFVKYRGGQPLGGVAPAYFEAVTMGSLQGLKKLQALTPTRARDVLAKAVESPEFRAATGPGANSLPKLEKRIEIISNAFQSA